MNEFSRNAVLIKLFDGPKQDLWNNFDKVMYKNVMDHFDASLWYVRHPTTMPGLLIKVPLENVRRDFSMALVLDLMYGGAR